MKRVVYTKRGGLEAIEIIEEDAPTPKADEVLIEVHRAGINFADLMMRQGLYGAAPDFPFTPGYEVSGVVLATGQDVKEHEVGDRVVALTGFGGYAEQVVVAQERAWTLPDNVSFDAAAAMPVTYLTSHHMLVHLGNFREGDSVLVYHAAGGVGTATAQIVKALNGGVIYGTSSPEKAEFVEKHGFVDKVVHRKELGEQISKLLSILLKKNSEVNSDNLNETSENIEPLTKAAS